ncbi:alpha-amylase [Aliivibrio sifiae]|uniref:Alpha-amylase n=1 Tax=Aliivibrio sifiae TaxID=566293 RepID=A0A2S7X039_9GAMM|nr:alpha-amylase [Aliivibrio sifiae]PQJ83194.1 alpha-amylase [Aliivibrio sifiae]
MKLSVCATLISLSLMVGCQSTLLPSTDNANSSSQNTPVVSSDSTNQVSVCPSLGIQPVTVTVSELWSEGAVVTDAYSGNIAQVKDGQITLTPSRHSGGLLLLESNSVQEVEAKKNHFQWKSATFYHIATDRFYNGNSWNDHSYGRQTSAQGFKGGDIAGLTQKLDYLAELGVDVLWLSTPLEQVHGWLPGKNGNTPEYPYAGGATLDWTQLDTNMGSEQEMRTFIDSAHQLGMRVVWSIDTVPSQPSLADLQQFSIQPKDSSELPSYWNDWHPKEDQNLTHYLDAFKGEDGQVPQWWSSDWFNLNYEGVVSTPIFFTNKPTTAVSQVSQDKYTLLTQWVTEWVTKFGIDGIVLAQSTPKLTKQFEEQGSKAFEAWKKDNQYKALEGASFIVVDLENNNHFIHQKQSINPAEKQCLTSLNYQIGTSEENDVSTLTWFDKDKKPELSSENYAQYRDAASTLLLSKGRVSVWYGDESAKAGDLYSMMNWDEMTGKNRTLAAHWKKLLTFRSNHSSISQGESQVIKQEPYYAFIRKNDTDKVMVVYTGE